jgi:hypothetical protein
MHLDRTDSTSCTTRLPVCFQHCAYRLTYSLSLGTDIKSLLINLASILLLILPVVAYLDRENAVKYAAGVGGSFLVAFIAPPLGWKRPHPYSDNPANRPYPRKED